MGGKVLMFKQDPMVVIAKARAELTQYIVDFDYLTHDEKNLELAKEEADKLDTLLTILGVQK